MSDAPSIDDLMLQLGEVRAYPDQAERAFILTTAFDAKANLMSVEWFDTLLD
jgi:hypothetical protein